jgi:hypothetical protein
MKHSRALAVTRLVLARAMIAIAVRIIFFIVEPFVEFKESDALIWFLFKASSG